MSCPFAPEKYSQLYIHTKVQTFPSVFFFVLDKSNLMGTNPGIAFVHMYVHARNGAQQLCITEVT